MTPWELLGIERTNDKLLIKKAYALQLKSCHPEENPDGFMALRQAYEAALKEADALSVLDRFNQFDNNTFVPEFHDAIEMDEEGTLLTDVSNDQTLFRLNGATAFSKIIEIYDDFFQRIDPDRWKSLMFEFTIEEYDALCTYMCHFLNDHYVLPLQVWQFLNKEFRLEDNREFRWIEFLYYDYGLKYDFNKEEQCDFSRYTELRLQGLLEFKNSCYEKAVDLLNQAEKIYAKDEALFRIRGHAKYMLY